MPHCCHHCHQRVIKMRHRRRSWGATWGDEAPHEEMKRRVRRWGAAGFKSGLRSRYGGRKVPFTSEWEWDNRNTSNIRILNGIIFGGILNGTSDGIFPRREERLSAPSGENRPPGVNHGWTHLPFRLPSRRNFPPKSPATSHLLITPAFRTSRFLSIEGESFSYF